MSSRPRPTLGIARGVLKVGLLGALSLTLGGSCGTDIEGSVAGTYTLTAVDGEPLPAEIVGTGELTSGQLDLRSNSTAVLLLVYDTGSVSREGNWSRSNTTILVRWDDDDELAFMTYTEGTISWTFDDSELVFER